ncbi:MAG: CPBP family intramembrane glutamic endopeptidase [Myxococcota bacterium]
MGLIAFLRRVHEEYVVDLRAHADAKAGPSPAADRQMVIVVMTVMACLILMRFYGSGSHLKYPIQLLRDVGLSGWSDALRSALLTGPDQQFNRKIFWAAARVVGYVVVPFTVAGLALRGPGAPSFRELFGLETRQFFRHVRAYLLMLAVIMPFVVGASFTSAFQAKYPFYRLHPGEGIWPWFVAWEVLYALQFLSLEIFYRGFMVHGLKPRLGHASIFVMMIPYMMIHFGKPLPECIGSIVAGFVLGTMSLKSGAVWWGAILHVVVAVTMDLLSLYHQGLLSL